MERFAELKTAVESVELVDAHAHNIVALDSTFPFLNCFSEASGDALSDVPHTINFKRSLKEIAQLYGSSLSLHAVQESRQRFGLESSSAICFKAAKISVLLIDDGIELDKKLDIKWHESFVPTVGRILRVEHVAEKILEKGSNRTTWTLGSFMEIFTEELKSVADKVLAFKSIVAYRSGLAINTEVTEKEAEEGLSDVLSAGNPIRISNKSFIDYIFVHALKVAQSYDLPMQIHTGFGDKDLDLRLVNPLHLRNLLEDKRFLKSRLVLLHASYPFSKEASYLASVYPQVYLDFGLAIPKLSFHGMISSVKELLELAPMNKVMFSTDGIAFAETFYLGAKKAREVVFSVLRDACVDGDLSIPEAIATAKDIFAENAKQFYKLDVSSKNSDVKPPLSSSFQEEELNSSLKDVTFVRIIWIDASGQHRCRVVPQQRFYSSVGKHGVGLTCACMGMSSTSDGPAVDTNLTASGEIRIVPDLSTKCRLPWLSSWIFSDMAYMIRSEMTLFHSFKCLAMGFCHLSSYCLLKTILNLPIFIECLVNRAELQYLHLQITICGMGAKQQEMVLADMFIEPGKIWEYCPREALRRVSKILKDEFDLVVNAGFENEFFLLKSVLRDGKEERAPFDRTSYCSTAAFDAASPILEEVFASLQSLNIIVEQLHAEAGKGQFEIALKYTDCSRAADGLIFTREVIRAVARKHGLLATFVPKYALDDIGSGSHVHISLSRNGENIFMASDGSSRYGMSKIGEAFMAGVLNHLPSILPFTAPLPNSYDRIQPNTWSGAYLCWGKENKEAPLRAASPPGVAHGFVSNFEIKTFDGCANPYLGLASIITAGIDGLRRNLSLPEPVDGDPEILKENLQRLPVSLAESVEALEKDTLFRDMIGEKLLVAIKGVRKAEVKYYSENKEAYKDLIYKY
ncbi:protein fluG isoform X1 [Nicotiana tabacum]|uniref:Protein fluG isoform X1 n=3 Tax=Nicotiana tabacum TaxID=4097 RepID=A0AC58UKX5_TOBAC